jgi:hypothetical protein
MLQMAIGQPANTTSWAPRSRIGNGKSASVLRLQDLNCCEQDKSLIELCTPIGPASHTAPTRSSAFGEIFERFLHDGLD